MTASLPHKWWLEKQWQCRFHKCFLQRFWIETKWPWNKKLSLHMFQVQCGCCSCKPYMATCFVKQAWMAFFQSASLNGFFLLFLWCKPQWLVFSMSQASMAFFVFCKPEWLFSSTTCDNTDIIVCCLLNPKHWPLSLFKVQPWWNCDRAGR